MTAFEDAAGLREAAMGREISVDTLFEREQKVRRDFWGKLKRVAGNVPFVDDLVAAYFCAMDPATPMRVRGMLLAALAYFIMPIDVIPDIVVGLGFADDMRDFAVAARMLTLLDIDRVRLLTNNPKKVTGLEQAGIAVEERLPIKISANAFNLRYLDTKRDRSGHQL